jgi:PBSX family phage terminase large subunit
MDCYVGFRNGDGEPSDALLSQRRLLDSNEKHVLAAGSLGWGKTDWLIVQATIEALSFPKNVILMGRKTLGALKKSTLVSFFDLVDPKIVTRHDKAEQSITFLNGSKIFYMQLDESREAMQKVKSMNLGAVMIDQIEEITENVWIACIGQMRRKNSSRRSFATANPNGHSWVWNRWIKKGGRKGYFCEQGAIWREGVPPPRSQDEVTLMHCDNPNLPWDYIVDRLEQPERWVRRYVYGSWDNFEGLVWSDFNEATHLIKPFEVPKWWNRYVVLDHGHRNPTAVLFFAVDGDGDIYIYDCHYEADQWIDYHAEQIWRKVGHDAITRWLADPSIFHVRGGMSTDVTIAGQYEEYGLYFERADNDKKAGIDRVAKYLAIDPVLGKPKLYVFDRPALDPFIEEITDYRWNDIGSGLSNNKEEPRKKNDHAMDSLRYAINHFEESGHRMPNTIQPEWLKETADKGSWKLV